MTPTQFEFLVTVPGEARLVEVVRQLTAHAAGYAQLPDDTTQRLATTVAEAATKAAGFTRTPGAPVLIRFTGTGQRLEVVISCEGARTLTPTPATSPGEPTVAWQHDGVRHTCHVTQPLPA